MDSSFCQSLENGSEFMEIEKFSSVQLLVVVSQIENIENDLSGLFILFDFLLSEGLLLQMESSSSDLREHLLFSGMVNWGRWFLFFLFIFIDIIHIGNNGWVINSIIEGGLKFCEIQKSRVLLSINVAVIQRLHQNEELLEI
jgi:hypothetical protein